MNKRIESKKEKSWKSAKKYEAKNGKGKQKSFIVQEIKTTHVQIIYNKKQPLTQKKITLKECSQEVGSSVWPTYGGVLS